MRPHAVMDFSTKSLLIDFVICVLLLRTVRGCEEVFSIDFLCKAGQLGDANCLAYITNSQLSISHNPSVFSVAVEGYPDALLTVMNSAVHPFVTTPVQAEFSLPTVKCLCACVEGTVTVLDDSRYNNTWFRRNDIAEMKSHITIIHTQATDFFLLERAQYQKLPTGMDLKYTDHLWQITTSSDSSTRNQSSWTVVDQCFQQHHAMRFLADIAESIGWEHTSVIFDSTYVQEANLLIDLLSKAGVKIFHHVIRKNESNVPFLQTSYNQIRRGWTPYIVLAQPHSLQRLFQELNVFDGPGLSKTAMKTFSMWLVWGVDVTSHFMKDKVGNISNVAVIERPGCPIDIADVWESSHGMCGHLDTIVPGRGFREEWRAENILQIKRKLASNFVSSMNRSTDFLIYTATWEPRGRDFRAVFTGPRQKVVSADQIFPNINYRLNKMHLTVTTLAWPIYVIKTNHTDGQITYEGLCFDLLDDLSRKLNFSYSLQEPKDQEWGRIVDGRWTGLMGDIVYKEADLALAPLSAQEERVAYVDFTTPFRTDYKEIGMRMNDKEKTRWMILLRPFSWKVLLVVACIFPAITVLLWICEKFSPFYATIPRRYLLGGLHHAEDCAWYMYGALFSRSGIYLPHATSGRCVVLCWWLLVVLLVATYCGNLMSLLAVTEDKKPFNSISEMVAQSDYIWGASNGTYFLELLKTSPDKEYKKVWKGIQKFAESDPSVLHPDLDVQINRTKNGNYAFITESTAVAVTLPGVCDLVKVDEQFMMLQYGIALPKNSAYTALISERIIGVTENGLIDMWAKKWTPRAVPCPAFLQTGARQIMLIDIQSAFYVLLGGIVMSCLLFLAEKQHWLCKPIANNREKKRL